MEQAGTVAEHAPIFWPLIVTAFSGLVAIIVATVASIGYIRKEARSVAEAVATHIADSITGKLTGHIAEIGAWRESMEDWKRSFHDSIKALRDDMRNVITRQAVLEEVGRRAEIIAKDVEAKIGLMEVERADRHAREEVQRLLEKARVEDSEGK